MDTASPLRRLVALEGDFGILVAESREFLYSLESLPHQKSVTLLQRVDVDRALKLFVEGFLEGDHIQEWAEILEMNEYIDYESGEEDVIADTLFRLATPEINEPISQAVALELRAGLRASS